MRRIGLGLADPAGPSVPEAEKQWVADLTVPGPSFWERRSWREGRSDGEAICPAKRFLKTVAQACQGLAFFKSRE